MPVRYQPTAPATGYGESDDWIDRFGHLAVAQPPAPIEEPDNPFVGGFTRPRANKPPPAMPVDRAWESPQPAFRMPAPALPRQSLTMQHALGTPPPRSSAVPSLLRPGAGSNAWRAQSEPAEPSPTSPISMGRLPNPNSPPTSPSVSASRKSKGSALRPSASASGGRAQSAPDTVGKSPKTPKTPSRAPRAKRHVSSSAISISSDDSDSSLPVSSPGALTPSRSSGGNKVLCAGRTVKGAPCKRTVKVNSDDDLDIPRLCHQHAKAFEEVTKFFARGNGALVTFSEWIPEHLSDSTRYALKTEMEKAAGRGEEPGYIYTFLISDPSTPNIVHLKVGRTVNLTQRIHQWARQCGSREQTLRGYWPGTVQAPEADEDDEVTTLLRGHVNAGAPGKASHRLERLIHLELADLVENAPYLDPAWPKSPASALVPPRKVKEKCDDCGTLHKEIFSFPRGKGKYKNREWDLIVQPVISRWGKFVEEYC